METLELHPAERIYSPGIICLPGESTRATATMPHTTVEDIRQLEQEGEFLHGATLTFRIKNVLLADGCIYASPDYRVVVPKSPRKALLPRKVAWFRVAQLCSDMPSEMYFGHWLLDGLSTERLALDRQLEALTFGNKIAGHKAQYRDAASIDVTPVHYALVDDLWLVNDGGLNSARMARWLRVRNRIRKNVAISDSAKYVYLVRSGGSEDRTIQNVRALEDLLSSLGFLFVDPMCLSALETAALLRHTKVVVSVEGSHQSHALMAMPSGATLLTIQPADRFLHSYLFFANAAGVRSAFTVADRAAEGFQVSLDRLQRTLDLIDRGRASSL